MGHVPVTQDTAESLVSITVTGKNLHPLVVGECAQEAFKYLHASMRRGIAQLV